MRWIRRTTGRGVRVEPDQFHSGTGTGTGTGTGGVGSAELLPRRPAPAWRVLLGLAALRLALYAYSNVAAAYGYTPDEFYFLDCAARLDWGYVDHPPLSIAVLKAVRPLLGDSLLGLRLLPALAGAAAVVLAGLMARELGGGRAAQALAASAELAAPSVLWVGTYYSMNAVELALLALATWVVLRICNGGDARLWVVLGALLGLALLNKASALWFGAGLAAALVLTRLRRWLATPWPWLAAAIATALAAPHVVWQLRNDWPTLEFMRNGMRDVMVPKAPLEFVRDQVRAMHPLGALITAAGLGWLAVARTARPYRALAWLWAVVFLVLLASGSARPYYLAPLYPIGLAAGGAAVECWARRRTLAWLPYAVGALIALGGILAAPLVMPLLPPERLVAYQRALGFEEPRTEFQSGVLPVHFELQFGWPELVDAVGQAYRSLPEAERAQAVVLTTTFGEAGAIGFLGPQRGLPRVVGTHNNYWLWGPGDTAGAVMLVVAAPGARVLEEFEEVLPAARVECRYCLPRLRERAVFVVRRPRRPFAEIWTALKDYS